jgi:tetratricopeptide (TPR) repeat protein
VVTAHSFLGIVQHARGQFAEAVTSFSLAAENALVVYPTGNRDIGTAFHNLGLSLDATGNRPAAIAALRRAALEHDRAERAGAGEGRPPSLDYYLGRLLVEDRAWRDGLRHLRSADAAWRRAQDPPPAEADTVGTWIARAYDQLGRPDSARYYRQRGPVQRASASELVSRPPGN